MTRCRDGTEKASYRRLTPNVQWADWNAEFDVIGQDTACLNHIFNKQELFNAGCLAQHHLFLFGGSVGTGLPMQLIKLLKPATYPNSDMDDWAGCSGCNIEDRSIGAPTFIDLVLNRQGEVLSMKSSVWLEPEIETTGAVNVDALATMKSTMQAAPDPGPGGIRITFFRARYYKAPGRIVSELFEATSGQSNTDFRVHVYSGVQHWWYKFCNSETYYCLRTEINYNSWSNIKAIAKVELQGMLKSFEGITKIRSVVIANMMFGSDFNDMMDEVLLSPSSSAMLMDERQNNNIGIGFADLEYYSKDHPVNLLHTLWMHRYLNIVCDNAGIGEVATSATIKFLGDGCTLQDRYSQDTWAQHLYQGCPSERRIVAPETNAPTRRPTIAGCTVDGGSCTENSVCCSAYCDSSTSKCQEEFLLFFPTSSPTTVGAGDEKAETLPASSALPTNWEYLHNSLDSQVGGADALERDFLSNDTLMHPAVFWLHYLLSVLSIGVLLWWYMGKLYPKKRQKFETIVINKTPCCRNDAASAKHSEFHIVSNTSMKSNESVDMQVGNVLGKQHKTSSNHNNREDSSQSSQSSNNSNSKQFRIATNSDQSLGTIQDGTLATTTRTSRKRTTSEKKTRKSKSNHRKSSAKHNQGDKHTSIKSSHNQGDKHISTTNNSRIDSQRSYEKHKPQARGSSRSASPFSSQSSLVESSNQPIRTSSMKQSNLKDSIMSPTKKPKGYVSAPQLPSLGFARYLASVHIVAGHLWRKDNPKPIEDWYTNDWGFTWVPWFMMLSGFVLTYARVASSHPDFLEKWYVMTYNRVKSIYPLYIVGLLAAAGIHAIRNQLAWGLGTPLESICSLILLQSWIPVVTDKVLQAHCWFLSCIIPYWMLHNFVYRKLLTKSNKLLWMIIAFASVLPTLLLLILPPALGFSLEWYKAYQLRETQTGLDLLVISLKFHPIFYFHVYVVGMVAAILHTRQCQVLTPVLPGTTKAAKPTLHFVHRFGASIGYFGLFVVFILDLWVEWPAAKLTCRLGALLPFQALSLAGLAGGQDPLERIFSNRFLVPLGSLSYPQYVFQFIAFDIWGTYTGVGFWLLLNALSLAGFALVQTPLGKSKVTRQQLKTGLLSGVGIITLCITLFAIRDFLSGDFEQGNVPPHRLQYTDTAFDIELDTSEVARKLPGLSIFATGIGFGLDDNTNTTLPGVAINPSVAWDEDNKELVVAYRRHYHKFATGFTQQLNFDGQDIDGVTIELSTWYSDVVTARLGNVSVVNNIVKNERGNNGWLLDNGNVLHVGRADEPWFTCQSSPMYIPENKTAVVTLRFGVEDPRLRYNHQIGTEIEPGWALTFNSLPPINDTSLNALADRSSTTPSSIVPYPICDRERRMFWRNLDDNLNPAVEAPIMLELNPSIAIIPEKNWLSFVNPSTGDQMFVQSIHPFVVVKLDAQTGIASEVSRFSFPLLKETSRLDGGLEFHGGANPVLLDEEYLSPSASFLSSFHTRTSDGRYVNFAFTFSVEAPYEITSVSMPLPLLMSPIVDESLKRRMTFSSGIVIVPSAVNRVIFSYGSSNANSRMLVMSKDELRQLFGLEPLGEIDEPDTDVVTTVDKTEGNVEAGGDCTNEGCKSRACVRTSEKNICIKSCEDPQFNWDCPYWTIPFRKAAEEQCSIKCRSS